MLGLYLAFVCAVVTFLAVSPSWCHAGTVLNGPVQLAPPGWTPDQLPAIREDAVA